jgi:hypothetical protein
LPRQETFLSGPAREHQGLARVNGGIVPHGLAVEHGLGLGINVKPVGESAANLAGGHVTDRQLLEVGPAGDRHELAAGIGGIKHSGSAPG